ncbi:hypothetical protein JMJ55_21435 [Belnapia sp. T6]|uniref:Protein ImuA n=1 Tax=Belnapia mucosa TaxID=2804532 RepID=A0ABS1V8A7_9PROT|nr:hypothetical protein [Belnapia mucosa]MBL6457903.1 hypothetical protein [Belnapia mucosa]
MTTPPSSHAEPEALPLDRPALAAALRARLARTEGPVTGSLLLCGPIDQSLPGGGLARAGLHEVLAAEPGAAAGFCAMLLARAGAGRGSLLWVADAMESWPPPPARFGLPAAELIVVLALRPEDALWAMEEGLRCPAIAGAVLVAGEIGPEAMRRLDQAAGTGGGVGLLLRPEAAGGEERLPLTLWRVGGDGGAGLGDPQWRLELLRCQGGRPGAWDAVWRPAAEQLDVLGAEPAPAPTRRRAR